MEEKNRIINLEWALRSERAGQIEFWQNNGDGTCTRVSDGVTLTCDRYDEIAASRPLARLRVRGRLPWDA